MNVDDVRPKAANFLGKNQCSALGGPGLLNLAAEILQMHLNANKESRKSRIYNVPTI